MPLRCRRALSAVRESRWGISTRGPVSATRRFPRDSPLEDRPWTPLCCHLPPLEVGAARLSSTLHRYPLVNLIAFTMRAAARRNAVLSCGARPGVEEEHHWRPVDGCHDHAEDVVAEELDAVACVLVRRCRRSTASGRSWPVTCSPNSAKLRASAARVTRSAPPDSIRSSTSQARRDAAAGTPNTAHLLSGGRWSRLPSAPTFPTASCTHAGCNARRRKPRRAHRRALDRPSRLPRPA
jgi:hypothetical protein